MNYTKPQVKTVGNAKAVIEQINPSKPASGPDGLAQRVTPAYDLDE